MAALMDEPDYSVFENKTGLAEDMKFLASMPELCDITFLVGETREPVCAVKAVLAARSRVFHKMLFGANTQQPASNPAPKSKKESKEKEPTKLKLFLKRSSEPMLSLPGQFQPQGLSHQTLIIDEFEPDVFRQLIEYIHTGCVTLQARTLLGVMNAADYYGLDELRKACLGFIQCCINVDTVCALLASAEKYIQYKCTKSLVQKVLEYIDLHGNEVLSLGSFTLLPQHVVRLVLCRDELKADELTKFQAAFMWSKRYYDTSVGGGGGERLSGFGGAPNGGSSGSPSSSSTLKEVMATFLEYVEFHKIPASVLMKEVHPLAVVPDQLIMNALAYQADPNSVDLTKSGSSPNRGAGRRNTQRSLSVQDAHDQLLNSSSTCTLSSYTGSSDMDSGRASNPDISPSLAAAAAASGGIHRGGALRSPSAPPPSAAVSATSAAHGHHQPTAAEPQQP